MSYNPPWSNHLDAVIMANIERPSMSWQALAERIGRSPCAVRARASMLRERRACAVSTAVHGDILEHDEGPPDGCADDE